MSQDTAAAEVAVMSESLRCSGGNLYYKNDILLIIYNKSTESVSQI